MCRESGLHASKFQGTLAWVNFVRSQRSAQEKPVCARADPTCGLSATACAVRNGLEVVDKKKIKKKGCQVLTALFAYSLYGESFVRRDSRLVACFVNVC